MLSALELLSVYAGDRLGLYRGLADGRARTSSELASELDVAERYVREWLEQQAVSGVLEVDDPAAEPGDRRFRLPEEHRAPLLEPTVRGYAAASIRGVVSASADLPAVLDAFRTGDGLGWHEAEYDEDEERDANRAMFEQDLAGWLAAVPSLHERLSEAARPAWVADVGCGAGWSTLAIAAAYPRARVHGVDTHAGTIERARVRGAAAGLADRVDFTAADAAHLDGGPYDLVCFFECLHDMPRPVDALGRSRERLAPEGVVLVGDERTAQRFTAPGDDLERSLYAWSVLSCLPYGMSGPDPAGTGTVMRPETVSRYAREAGFTRSEVLGIEHPEWRFYLLTP